MPGSGNETPNLDLKIPGYVILKLRTTKIPSKFLKEIAASIKITLWIIIPRPSDEKGLSAASQCFSH